MQYCPICEVYRDLKLHYRDPKGTLFYFCDGCDFVLRSPEFHLTKEENERRYKLHQNNVFDLGYQNFLKPVVEAVFEFQRPEDVGLDYGCGPGSVIEYLLKQKRFQIQTYDPLFEPVEERLRVRYDYVTCTEVAEHFEYPLQELSKIKNLLKPQGRLYIKTSLTDSVQDFPGWHYHRDPSHVSFFSRRTFEIIKSKLNFSILQSIDQGVLILA